MTVTEQPLVSIVTPVHNTEGYLAECIESVIAQSYGNWEYVIVENCSSDRSREIATDFAGRDPRIRVVTTDRLLPQLENYNFALRQISQDSSYCKMVQADDWLFSDCVEKMIDLAETDEQVVIVGSYQLAGDKVVGGGLPCSDRLWRRSVVPGTVPCRLFLAEDKYVFGTPTSVLYRRDLIRSREPFFEEFNSHEDVELCYQVLDRFKFGFVHEVLTFSRRENISLTSEILSHDPYYKLYKYLLTRKFGERYLTPSEYSACLDRAKEDLYAFLARNIFRGRSQDFWNYHSNGLDLVGESLNMKRLYRMQVARFGNKLGNPLGTLQGILEGAGRGKGPGS